MKRVFLLVLTNILVMATLGVLWVLLTTFTPLGAWMNRSGMNLGGLAIMCLFWGFGGAFISLLISRWMAKRAMGVELIDPDKARGEEAWLVQTVHRLARNAGIKTMPEVGIYPSMELNAFATGPGKESALVAVSAGLMQRMSHDELEGVLGHELSHVANGDMVTLTLIQGVVNAFVMFISWILTMMISNAMRGNREDRREGFGDFMLRSLIHNMLSMLLAFGAYLLIVAPFSRYREFRADKGGADKAGKSKMIAALQALKAAAAGDALRAKQEGEAGSPALAAFKISGPWKSLLSTHPPIDERIARLNQADSSR